MKAKGILIGATALVIALTVIICVMANSGVFNPYEHQLSLAQKFLEEGNYEEAIIAFNKAIEIDSKRLDTYFALAEVYFENLDDLGGVKETLQRAYENTSEDSVAEKYIEFADRLTAKGKNTDAMELLSSGFDLTGNENIESKIKRLDVEKGEAKEDFENAENGSPRSSALPEDGESDKDDSEETQVINERTRENSSDVSAEKTDYVKIYGTLLNDMSQVDEYVEQNIVGGCEFKDAYMVDMDNNGVPELMCIYSDSIMPYACLAQYDGEFKFEEIPFYFNSGTGGSIEYGILKSNGKFYFYTHGSERLEYGASSRWSYEEKVILNENGKETVEYRAYSEDGITNFVNGKKVAAFDYNYVSNNYEIILASAVYGDSYQREKISKYGKEYDKFWTGK